ncbi:MAG: hybrid sensor histidine kinase/response regulator [Cyanobacteria bacterium NC_groundwater_1444_Ag_S-0.65um_54_12]|nr:hybrid sensor histidine kinase/response regulator [Cyanobacteria bacterium NC_groundwater_1444_Ag_S-0.65um_54_12]
MNLVYSVLLVEDNPGDAELIAEILPAEEFRSEHVETLAAAIQALSRKVYDLILLDLGLPDATGLEGVERINHQFPDVALVVLTGLQRDDIALQAVQAGAQDYLNKGKVDKVGVARALRHAIARKEIAVHKSRFLSTVSHEMRTPLNIIQGFASILDDEIGGPLTNQQKRCVRGILGGADRLVTLIEDLLDAAQIAAGHFSIRREPVNVSEVVATVVAAMAPLAKEKGVELKFDKGTQASIELDRLRIAQVLTNLLSNAIKFTPTNGEVKIRVSREAESVKIEVSDTGIGISLAFRPNLFKLFSQAPQGQQTKGTGLGLYVSKSIVEAHGGEINVNSVPGVGSTFWFTLPLQRSA